MIFQRDERRVIVSFLKGEIKRNLITDRLEWMKACREFERALFKTSLFKGIIWMHSKPWLVYLVFIIGYAIFGYAIYKTIESWNIILTSTYSGGTILTIPHNKDPMQILNL